MEDLGRLDTAPDQLVVRSRNVGNNEQQGLSRAGCGRGEVGAELDRAMRAWRRELDEAEFIAGAVAVEPPPQSP